MRPVSRKPGVIVLDDDGERAALIARSLAGSYDVATAGTVGEAWQLAARRTFSAALVDWDLAPGGSGIQFLLNLAERLPLVQGILYSMHYGQTLRWEAMRLADVHVVLDARAPRFLREAGLVLAECLAPAIPVVPGQLTPIGPAARARWGAVSRATRTFLEELHRAARSRSHVYLVGEPGSGKRLAAALLLEWRRGWRRGGGVLRRVAPGPCEAKILFVPPLRRRTADLPMLVGRHLLEAAGRDGARARVVSADALEAIRQRPWWGNVRELQQALDRACARTAPGSEITAGHLLGPVEPAPAADQWAKLRGQRDSLLRALEDGGSVTGAARLLKISRANLQRRMEHLGVVHASVLPGDRKLLAGHARLVN